MQLTEKVKDGLKREVEAVFLAQTLVEDLNKKISEAKTTIQLKGFRPGKVPETYLRNTYGKSFMAQIINDKISSIPGNITSQTGEKIASTPEFNINEDERVVENVINGQEDLVVNVKYEVLPKFEIKDFSSYEISRPIVEVAQEEVDKQVEEVLASTKDFTAKDAEASIGDRVTMDYVGKINGTAFDNGSDKDAHLILGSNNFIPGFEEQLVGLKAGEKKEINVTFPKNYGASELAGKNASFDITVKKVESAEKLIINDDAAKKLGVESLEKLNQLIKSQLENRYGSVTRQKVKRQILDLLAKDYDFELPPKLVDLEYENINAQFKSNSASADEKDNKIEESEYKNIAQRRVRLGLLIAQIAQEAKIDVSKDELQKAMFQQMQHFPGQEKEIIKLFQTNPDAMASLRAPILEDKVIDYIVTKSKVIDKVVLAEDLMRDDEEAAPKETTKKSSAKKTTSTKKKKE